MNSSSHRQRRASPAGQQTCTPPGGSSADAESLVSYQLLIELPQALSCRIGRLGLCHFPAGRYLYTGSARRNLEARIARHLAREKKLRWHIDWLLAAPGVRIIEVARSALAECPLNQATAGQVIVPGFGASDCRAGCGSHLKWLGGGVP